jgi:hypothetical protein
MQLTGGFTDSVCFPVALISCRRSQLIAAHRSEDQCSRPFGNKPFISLMIGFMPPKKTPISVKNLLYHFDA